MPTKELCNKCSHYWGVDSCDAFHDHIPEEIFTGDNDHSEPIEGQVGEFVFEEIE